MKQEKIAITLDPYILREVEKTIDGVNVRSRSQAIEVLLRKALSTEITLAVILAGGPHGEEKAMHVYKGIPVLQLLIQWMSYYGIKTFYIVTSKDAKSLRKHFGDGSRYGVKISYVIEKRSLGTAGAIRLCKGLLDSDFVVANCDSLFDFDLRSMMYFHRRNGRLVTIAVKEHIATSKYGTVDMEGDTIKGFYEKSVNPPSRIVNTGLYIMSPEVLRYLPKKGTLEQDVFPRLADEGKLGGFIFTSGWKDLESYD